MACRRYDCNHNRNRWDRWVGNNVLPEGLSWDFMRRMWMEFCLGTSPIKLDAVASFYKSSWSALTSPHFKYIFIKKSTHSAARYMPIAIPPDSRCTQRTLQGTYVRITRHKESSLIMNCGMDCIPKMAQRHAGSKRVITQ